MPRLGQGRNRNPARTIASLATGGSLFDLAGKFYVLESRDLESNHRTAESTGLGPREVFGITFEQP
jgi:hypothetical protein